MLQRSSKKQKMNILFLYNSTQTYTNTVFEHLASFARDSRHRTFFCHVDQYSELVTDLSRFDAVGLHYTIRLPFDQVSPSAELALSEFRGLKFLFIQDEYDHTHRAWHWINKLGLNLVFTVVPEASIEQVYPALELPGVRFVSNLTGYVPEGLSNASEVLPPSKRCLMIGYRGRPLPIRYGQLGIEKVSVGEITKNYCDTHGIMTDIAWSEESRIYGPKWYEFMTSCRSMLGSESGSNVFDWDGSLFQSIEDFKENNPSADDMEIYEQVIRPREIDGIMNQISPRVFEAIAARTVLVLFDGDYSGVVKPGEHFIPLNKDGSNLTEVISFLQDEDYVDAMAERAYQDVIASGKYSYKSFVAKIDDEIEHSLSNSGGNPSHLCVQAGMRTCYEEQPIVFTTTPLRAKPPKPTATIWWRVAIFIWSRFPEVFRDKLRPYLSSLFKRG